ARGSSAARRWRMRVAAGRRRCRSARCPRNGARPCAMSNDTRRSDRSIDWDLARARLARIEAGIDAAFDPPPERARDIMESRARALARDPKSEAAPVSALDVVLF